MNAAPATATAERDPSARILLLFAVRDEARHFRPSTGVNCAVVISGIGKPNAEHALRQSLEAGFPHLVLTCGYAGGLNPALRQGEVVFDADAESGLRESLPKLGARPARFHCADRVIVTAAEKQALWQLTNADAVEMESAVVRDICHRRHIPTATIRVISDDAHQDLPMDFNPLSKPDGNISYRKLARALVGSPGLVPKLLRFQRELGICGRALGKVLGDVVDSVTQGKP
jgi:adenosylhomocysteine nucleosidase